MNIGIAKRKLFKFCAALLILLSFPGSGFCYEGANGGVGKSEGPVNVALVPLSQDPSEDFKRLVEGIARKLERTKGLRVQDRRKTNELLNYYRLHTATTSKTTSQNQGLTVARDRIREVRYDEAKRILDRLEGSGSSAPDLRGNDLAQIYILRAKILHSRGLDNEVQDEFEKLVRVNPDYELDSRLYGKWARNALDQARTDILKGGTGSVTVRSSPEASEVFVNGFHRGITPLTLTHLSKGKHVVEVRTVNHRPVSREIEIQAGDRLKLNETLVREEVAAKGRGFVSLNPRDYQTEEQLSRMVTTLGYQLAVDKVILVSDEGISKFVYRLGDTHLGAIQKLHEGDSKTIGLNQLAEVVAQRINSEARTDILKDPGRFADQTVGSVALHEKRKTPFYKRPLFWVLVAAGAGTGGALSAVLGSGAAAASAGGILIGL